MQLYNNGEIKMIFSEDYVRDFRTEVTPDEIDNCKRWISEWATPRKTINRKYSSYRLKHVVETWCGKYVSSESFVIAAIESGYNAVSADGSAVNAFFNMSYERARHENYEKSGWYHPY